MSEMCDKKYEKERKLAKKRKCVNRAKRVIRYGGVTEYEYLVSFNDAQKTAVFFFYTKSTLVKSETN